MKMTPSLRRYLIPTLLFIVVSSVYYATSAGTTSSNDGSHYALLRSMMDEGRFRIETYAHFAEGNDLSIRDDVIYSDRPPGTALMAAPFYALGGVMPRPIHDLPTRHDEGNPRLAYVMMLPALAAAGAGALFYGLLRRYEVAEPAALLASLALAFGTTLFKYGGVLYSHAPSALLITAGIVLMIRLWCDDASHPLTGAALGLILGLSVLVEYSNAIFAVILGSILTVHLVWSVREWRTLIAFATGAAIPAAFLAYYNTVNFGSPLTTSYAYAINYPWAASFATTFDVPWRQGLPGVLWYGIDARDQPNQGLLLLMPVVWAALGGLVAFWRKRRYEAGLILGVFVVYLLLFARHHTFSGFTFDTRYLAPFLPLLFVSLGFVLAWMQSREWSIATMLLWMLFFGLLFLSVRNLLAHIAFSYNYHLDPGLVERSAATPENWSYILGNIFVNWRNLPLLWLVEGLAMGVIILGAWSAGHGENPRSAD